MTIQPLFKDAKSVESLETNITRAATTADMVRTMFGPFGRIKLLVDGIGRTHLAWTGREVYDEVEFDHPITEMVIDIAESQWSQHGDGSTMAVVLTGELLSNASTLLESGLHPTTIREGYFEAASVARNEINECIVHPTPSDEETIESVIRATLSGSGIDDNERLASMVTDVVLSIAAEGNDPTEYVHIEPTVGRPIEETEVVEGTAIYQKPGHVDMPDRIDNATVALVDTPFDVDSSSSPSSRTVSDFEDRQKFYEHERAEIESLARQVVHSGANVVLCNDAIEDVAYDYLTQHGVFSLRHTDSEDMNRVAAATGAKRVSDLNKLDSSTLGEAQTVEQDIVGSKDLTVVRTTDGTAGVTILPTSTTKRLSDRLENAISSGIKNAESALADGVVCGAGSIEMRMASAVRSQSRSFNGREQFAMESYADALEEIPRLLAINSGRDPIDALVSLREGHQSGSMAGVTTPSGAVESVDVSQVCDPVAVKKDAVGRATEAAVQILRINKLVRRG